MTRWNSRWGWAALAALVLTPAAGSAQVRPRAPERGAVEQRVRARFGQMVRDELKLTAEQLDKVESAVQSFENQRRGLITREAVLRRRMRGGAQTARSDDEAQQILREMVALREDETRLFRGEMDELRKTLTSAQALRFYEMRADLMDRVQRLRQPRAGGPGGGPPGPGGGPPLGR